MVKKTSRENSGKQVINTYQIQIKNKNFKTFKLLLDLYFEIERLVLNWDKNRTKQKSLNKLGRYMPVRI